MASIGRFSRDKRQLEQIEIASRLPELEFLIMGFVGDAAYHAACVDAARELPNVHVLGDVPLKQLEENLMSSCYFLHTARNEPFGITAVQAIGVGVIPVVHDSGGQREVVHLDRLRFQTADEAAQILARLYATNTEHTAIRDALFAHARKFSEAEFRSRMKPILERLLYP